MGDGKNKLLQTLHYSDIFSFPLTLDEIYYYFHSSKKTSKKTIEKYLSIANEIDRNGDYFFLKGRKNTAIFRQKNEDIFAAKLEKAQKIAENLSWIPTIYFIGLSGSLGAGAASGESDIDFFIITQKKYIYFTRFFCILFLRLTGNLRRRNQKYAPDKICLNMFLSEEELMFSRKTRNIYTAREIAQIEPLFERGGTYKRFLRQNIWVGDFLANSLTGKSRKFIRKNMSTMKYLQWFEYLLRIVQLSFIKRHQTTENVTNNALFFHPNDKKMIVLSEYYRRIKKANLL
ncbi:MAG: hypothetical protein QG600_162 [Patescibacteria group bacterium]|jgi:hypothetical protein|nr:hypothetical protein [Patescibacteria group bacterium]